MVFLYGPRPVHPHARRVCIPKSLAVEFGMSAGSHVRVELSSRSDSELAIRPASPPTAAQGRRDIRRPRLVNAGGQVTLPASLLEQVGVSPQHPLVFFVADDTRAEVRIIPARQVSFSGGSPRE